MSFQELIKENKIMVSMILFILVGGGYIIYGAHISSLRMKEIEIIIIRKYPYDEKRVGITTVREYNYVFFKEDAEPFHPGGIYWIKYKQGKVLDFRKLGDVGVLSLGDS